MAASGRTIAIGDIHGCRAALEALLDAVAPQPDDVLIVLGDMIDRGPDSRGVLQRLLSLRDECQLIPLLGNHEEMLLTAGQNAVGGRQWRYWMEFGGDATLASYGGEIGMIPPEHISFVFQCVPYHETETHLFLHANYLPHLALPEQGEFELRWLSLHEFLPGPHQSGKTAVVGHTAQTSGEVLRLDHLICIDTFCHGGGWLTALDVDSLQVWQADLQGKLRP